MRATLFTCFLILSTFSYGQVDSLKRELLKAKDDTTKIFLYVTLGEHLYLDLPDSAIFYWKKAEEHANKTIAKHGKKSKISETSLYLLGSAVNNIGYIYDIQGNIREAIDYYHKSLRIEEKLNRTEGIAISLNNIGAMYITLKDNKKALTYFQKSLEIAIKNKSDQNKGMAYLNIGDAYMRLGKIEESIRNIEESVRIREAIGDEAGLAYSLNYLASNYNKKGDHDKALEYGLRALEIRKKLNDVNGMALSYSALTSIYMDQGKYPQALEAGLKALEIAKKHNFFESSRIASKTLSKVYQKMGKYKEAFEMYTFFVELSDSIASESNKKAFMQKEFEYEYDKKHFADSLKAQEEKQISAIRLQSEKTKSYALYGGIIVLFAFLFFVYNRLKVTRKQKELIEEQKIEVQTALNERETLLKEIHHRVKNNLQIVSSLLNLQHGYANNKTSEELLKISESRIQSMALIHEELYKNNNFKEIDLNEYISNFIEHIRQSYLSDDSNIKINSSVPQINLDIDQLIPTGLIIHEMLINSIKHAFDKHENPSPQISIKVEQDKEDVKIKVFDNGSGLPENFTFNQHESLGVRLINGLVKQLKGNVKAYNLEDGSCFEFNFKFATVK